MAYVDHISVDGVQYDIRDAEAVSFEQEQTLNDVQQEQARANIGAGSETDVADLKSQMMSEEQKTYSYADLTWVNGYIKNDGSITSHNYYRASEFLPVIVGDIISYDGLISPGSSYCIIAAYSTNGVSGYLDNKSVRGDGTTQDGTYTVPDGVAYIRVSTYDSGTPRFVSLQMTVIANRIDSVEDNLTGISGQIDGLDERVATLEQETPEYHYDLGFDDYDHESGKAPSVSGEYVDAALECTDYISTANMLSVAASNVSMPVYGAGNYVCVIGCYDENKTLLQNKSLIADGTYGEIRSISGTVTITSDIKYIRLSRRTAYAATSLFTVTYERTLAEDYAVTKGKVASMDAEMHAWTGKTWIAFGTSLTDTNNTLAPDGTATGKYVPYLEQMSGMQCTNHGSAGAHVSGGILANVVGWSSQLQNADLITVEGSVNDWFSGIPLGEVGDTAPYLCTDSSDPDYVYEQPSTAQALTDLGGSKNGSFAGALYQIFKQAQLSMSAYGQLVYITDTTGKLYSSTDERRSVGITEKITGHTVYQNDYIMMAVAVANYMSIPVIDAGRMSRISEDNPDMIIDQIHHTEAGGYRYAKTIWSVLKNIPPIEPLV